MTSRPVSRAAGAVVTTLLIAALAGCNGSSGGSDGGVTRTSPSESPAPEPALSPLSDATATDSSPDPLQKKPSLNRAETASETAQTRAAAEQFALETAHLIMDVRQTSDAQDMIDAIVSKELDPAVKQFLVQDIAGQRELGTARHYDTGVDMWIRSQSIGPANAPERVSTEIAGILVSDPLDISAWYRTRIDVAWEGGRWRLVNYSSGDYGPDSSSSLTEAERTTYLEGAGWRKISAG